MGADPQRAPLLLLSVTAYVLIQSLNSNGCTHLISYRDNSCIVACGHYLAAAVSLAPEFFLWPNTSQYTSQWCARKHIERRACGLVWGTVPEFARWYRELSLQVVEITIEITRNWTKWHLSDVVTRQKVAQIRLIKILRAYGQNFMGHCAVMGTVLQRVVILASVNALSTNLLLREWESARRVVEFGE
jgi:hypothetical protein